MPTGFSASLRRVNGIDLLVAEGGRAGAPLAILLHGFPDGWWVWRRQAAALAEAGFRVLLPQGRGYAGSAKPSGTDAYRIERLAADVVALADGEGAGRFALVGHDWGGLVAWWVAGRHPDRVERLAILAAPHPDVFGSYLVAHPGQALRSGYIAFFQLPVLPERALTTGGYRALKRAVERGVRPGTLSPAEWAAYRRAWAEPGALTGMLNWYRALPRRPRAPLGRIEAPTLVAWGGRDPFLEAGLADRSLERCRAGERLVLPHAGHWLQLEETATINARLLAHLGGVERSGARA
ncbi:MAG: alpha/beta hydrolase [Methylobacteriaceae bacterium]|nr:alpha/beta hydrolase [Methylobacteriaceae bacterium]